MTKDEKFREYSAMFADRRAFQKLLPRKHREFLKDVLVSRNRVFAVTGSRGGGKTLTLNYASLLFLAHGDGNVLVVCDSYNMLRCVMEDIMRTTSNLLCRGWKVEYVCKQTRLPCIRNEVANGAIYLVTKDFCIREIGMSFGGHWLRYIDPRLVVLPDVHGIDEQESRELKHLVDICLFLGSKVAMAYLAMYKGDEAQRLVRSLNVRPHRIMWYDCPRSWYHPKVLKALREEAKKGRVRKSSRIACRPGSALVFPGNSAGKQTKGKPK